MKITRKVKLILKNYESDNPGTKGNICRILIRPIYNLTYPESAELIDYRPTQELDLYTLWTLAIATGLIAGPDNPPKLVYNFDFLE